MNIPPRKEEGYNTYSLTVRGILHLEVGLRSLLLLRSRHKNHPMPHDLCMLRFMIITFTLCIKMDKSQSVRDISPNARLESSKASS
jgi:hypothetical protein